MSQDLNDIEWTSLARYLAGEGSAAEVEHWMSADPERSVWVGQLRQVFEARRRVPDNWDIEEELRRFRARVKAHANTEHALFKGGEASGTEPRPRRVFKPHPLRRGVWYTLGEFVIGIALLVTGWKFGNAWVTAHNATVAEAYTTYTTAPGERATITLPDGGTVALNVASRLKVPLNYMTDNHTVRLDGEGLFTVPHRTGTSLTVIAGAATVRVLGTSFTVRHYVTDTVTTVAVRDGKVAVGSAVVTANRSVVVGRNGIPSSQPVDTSLFTFATGTLTLNGLSLPAAIVELDRWYDADIRLADSTLTARRIGGEFATGSLADLVTILKMTLNVRVVRDGRVLTIFSER